MSISTHLLERACQLIDANQLQNAELVLDAVVRVNPNNVMAWKVYLQICQSRNDLEWLMERILKNKELSNEEKEDIRDYQKCLLKGLTDFKQNINDAHSRSMLYIEPEQEPHSQDDMVMFELIDEFDYPARKTEQVKRRRPRQFFKYNIPLHVWEAAALLAIFYASVRLLVLGHSFGYLMMGAFVVGGLLWFGSINDHKVITPTNVTHAYSLESENELFIIDKPVVNAKADGRKKDSPRSIRYLDE
ncbi:MAG: hypothetical protein HY863_11080 [Chloroflexi bacterium]|nr:hypothetical protein [Chloroflexota bacterium]